MKRLATPCPPIAGTLNLILLVDSELIIPTLRVSNKLIFPTLRVSRGPIIYIFMTH